MTSALAVPYRRGRKRVRCMDPRFKEKVARMAARGEGFRSGSHVLQMMGHFAISPLAMSVASSKTANNWLNPAMAKYLAAIQSFGSRWRRGGVVSLSWDGTRLSNKDRLFSTMYLLGQAFWCPPMVPSSAKSCCKSVLVGRQKVT